MKVVGSMSKYILYQFDPIENQPVLYIGEYRNDTMMLSF